jgi:hypothetical protein
MSFLLFFFGSLRKSFIFAAPKCRDVFADVAQLVRAADL